MATVTQAADKTASRLGQAGKDIWDGTKNAFKKAPAAPVGEAAAEAASKPGFLRRAAVAPVKGLWYVASRPIVWGTELVGFGASKIGSGFKAHPRLALGATAVAAGLGVGHVLNKRAEHRAQNDINELEMAQLRVAQGQAQANTMVTPADYAAMEARMRQGGQNGGFAAGIQAERAAAMNPQGPAV